MTRNAGFDFHLTKPLDREELEQLLLPAIPRDATQAQAARQQRH